jgi:hypothetical protein
VLKTRPRLQKTGPRSVCRPPNTRCDVYLPSLRLALDQAAHLLEQYAIVDAASSFRIDQDVKMQYGVRRNTRACLSEGAAWRRFNTLDKQPTWRDSGRAKSPNRRVQLAATSPTRRRARMVPRRFELPGPTWMRAPPSQWGAGGGQLPMLWREFDWSSDVRRYATSLFSKLRIACRGVVFYRSRDEMFAYCFSCCGESDHSVGFRIVGVGSVVIAAPSQCGC